MWKTEYHMFMAMFCLTIKLTTKLTTKTNETRTSSVQDDPADILIDVQGFDMLVIIENYIQ